ncbi:protein PML-like [Babylonia areolata]|uniref:protein PML-like n=1 Tax=Babylonia areolata TaxID=304850 RepID=UPI003FD04371
MKTTLFFQYFKPTAHSSLGWGRQRAEKPTSAGIRTHGLLAVSLRRKPLRHSGCLSVLASLIQPPPPQGEAPLPQPPLQLEAVPSSPPPPPPSSDLKTRTECPVCHEDYTLPKLLPCNHLACQHCIVDWLHKTDQKGGCPLCRTPILPEDPYRLFRFPQNDPLSLVDAMPTDMTMVGLVEGGKILNSRNVCQLCDSNYSSASSSFYFCLQCPMKLCHSCVKVHAKIPGLKKHVVEALSELTPERLAQVNRCKCGRHEDRMADMYCPAHRELICTPCARKEHWGCGGVTEVQEAAKERREELTAEAKELMVMETAMKTQAKALSSKFQAMRQETNQVFDQIQNGVETRRHEILSRVKAEEDKMALPQLDVDRSTVTSSAAVIGRWVQSAPDDALLEMTDRMRPRLTDLKQRITQENRVCRAELVFDSGALTQLESAVGGIGRIF